MYLLSSGSWFSQFGSAFVEKVKEEIRVGDIGEEINHGILQWKQYFKIGDISFLLTDAIIVSWIAIVLVIILGIFMKGKLTTRPKGKQVFLWLLVELIINTCMSFGMNRKEAEVVAPMTGTFGLIIAGCNVISTFKIAPPAKNIAFPVAMAVFAIIYVAAISIRFVGIKGFWASLIHPMPAMLPFKILDFLIKPVSLSLRLFGNVFGAFVFMEFLYIIVPVVLPGIFGIWFDIADGLLQAVVFSYLTMSYIGEIVEIGHEQNNNPPPKGGRKVKQKKNEKSVDAVAGSTAAA